MDRKDFLKARIMEGMGKKSGTKPMSDKEKSLAALAHPKDKITHKDVLVGRGVLKKEEVELDEMDKSQPSSSRGAEGLPLGKKAEPIKTDKAKQDALKALQKQYKKVKEEVEQIDELKKSTMASYVKKASASYGRDKQLIGRESPDGTVKNSRPEMKKAVKNRLAGINRAAERLAKEEVEQIDEAGALMRKLVPGLGRIQAASKAEKQRDLAKSFAREVPPKERGDTNPSDGYHHPNTSANRHWKRHWQFQKIATKQKPFQPLQQKEEVEQVDEASWTSATSMHGATRKQNRTNPPTHNIRKGDVVKTSDGKKGTVSFVDGDDIHVTGTNIYYPKKTEKHSASTLKKEEVDLDEAFINGREYASHGLMHPDHAKWQSHRVGVHTDFYAHGTGDKINGQVMKNDGKEVHIKATKSSGGKLHKFKVQSELPK